MAQHHSEQNTQHLYEGDQSKLYSGVMNHHFHGDLKSETSKKQISRIWKIFWILLVVTIIEVLVGMYGKGVGLPHAVTAAFFLLLTVLKAFYIVRVFMHLGDEMSNFIVTVLIPLSLFIWFIIAFLADGGFWLHMNQNMRP